MKRFFTSILILFCFTLHLLAQKDMIIRRDGFQFKCCIVQVGTNETMYREDSSKKKAMLLINNKDIYMIKYDKRGNVFFTPSGEHYSGKTNKKISKDATLIYLCEGQEIVAYDLEVLPNQIIYKEKKGKKIPTKTIPRDKVFLVKYPDGTRDILNSI